MQVHAIRCEGYLHHGFITKFLFQLTASALQKMSLPIGKVSSQKDTIEPPSFPADSPTVSVWSCPGIHLLSDCFPVYNQQQWTPLFNTNSQI